MRLKKRLKEQALTLGFELAGIAPALPADGFDRLQKWLAAGFGGSMAYMGRHELARRHPASILPEVKSVLMVALNYGPFDGASQPLSLRGKPGPPTGKVARMRVARITTMSCAASSTSCWPGCKHKCRECKGGASSIPHRCWSVISRAAPAWDGSAKIPC